MSGVARIKAILGGSAGNLVEWYDWFAYSSTSLYFAAHFFPKGDRPPSCCRPPPSSPPASSPGRSAPG